MISSAPEVYLLGIIQSLPTRFAPWIAPMRHHLLIVSGRLRYAFATVSTSTKSSLVIRRLFRDLYSIYAPFRQNSTFSGIVKYLGKIVRCFKLSHAFAF